MDNEYRINDMQEKKVYVNVASNYIKLSDAKQIYRNSISKQVKDDSLTIVFGNEESKEIYGEITFGVEDGEQFALSLLNLCHSIKY